MSKLDAKAEEILSFQVNRQVTNLFKEYLFILEKLVDEHKESSDKLKQFLPDQYKVYVDLSDFLTETKFSFLRREILGRGNDAIRNVDQELDKFKIDFK